MDTPEDLPRRVRDALHARGETVACAESLTGGELAALLSGLAGSSATFVGGVVSYATSVKRTVLGVTAEQVVSEECAVQMAVGVRRLTGAHWALSTTGVAGPEEQDGQPVGTVYVGVAGPHGARAQRLALTGDRAEIRARTCVEALAVLLAALG